MKKFLNIVLFYVLYGMWYLVSLLPMWVHYLGATALSFVIEHVVGYRRKVIRKNLRNAYPDKSLAELRHIEHEFYRFFCDYIAETLKFATMSRANIRKRMVFTGLEPVLDALNHGRGIALMLGHYGNWEWVTSLRLWLGDSHDNWKFGHIYHPLENKALDRLFLTFRNRMGSQSVAMKETLRWILTAKREGKATMLGYISDQVPTWQNIHHWLTFLNQDTPVFTGVERIARSQHQAVFYLDVTRVRRGYYKVEIKPITADAAHEAEHYVTDTYFRMMEATINRAPQFWLWSHNRWKRTREEFNRRFQVVDHRVIERVKLD